MHGSFLQSQLFQPAYDSRSWCYSRHASHLCEVRLVLLNAADEQKFSINNDCIHTIDTLTIHYILLIVCVCFVYLFVYLYTYQIFQIGT